MSQLTPASLASFVISIPSRCSAFCSFKIAVMVFVSMFFICPSAYAYQLTLQWDPNVEQDLAGYIVYYGTASRNYNYDVDVGDETSCTISRLYSGVTYYFAVTAYDIDGNESSYSNEISYPTSNLGASSGGGGGGGCFITAGADGEKALDGLIVIAGLMLATFAGFLAFHRKRCKSPTQNLP